MIHVRAKINMVNPDLAGCLNANCISRRKHLLYLQIADDNVGLL